MIAKNIEDKAIRIVSIEKGKFLLDEEKLLEILTQPNAQNKPVHFQLIISYFENLFNHFVLPRYLFYQSLVHLEQGNHFCFLNIYAI